ncbi:nuclear transport factor 2 family protein [Nonomuraea sp. NPDC050394]|uniref:nuclear transport factor 2 family protein n=1 Tax=Nonomuraea sp. NPDC050394 TaxID=3364363 RepID=UPI0037B3E1B7
MARDAVWAVITGMYEAYTRGDRDGIDRRLHPEATIFDSDHPGLITTREQLNKVRDARPDEGPVTLTAYDEVVDVWGESALARYVLRVAFETGAPQIVRTTSVLRREGGEWRIVHVHENTL